MWYNTTMKVSKHPLYHIWNGMVRRCRDNKNINYPLNMWHNGARQYIGTYDTIEEASVMRDKLVAQRD